MSDAAAVLFLASHLQTRNCSEPPLSQEYPPTPIPAPRPPPAMDRASTTSTVTGEHTPLLPDSASDDTLRGNGNGPEWGAPPLGLPLADGLLNRVAAMYQRAIRSHERRRDGDLEAPGVGDVGVTHVSRCRGSFICLTIWVLLFLQGAYLSRPPQA
ncbi:hypothetical protein IMZ48_07565 [Candidatus Bathyarchaeota archaeon]|nr:hypothetical protein [Candidatus Bathyarchaeota archaeon]